MAGPAYSKAKLQYLHGASPTNPNPTHLNTNDVYEVIEWGVSAGALTALVLDKNGALYVAVNVDDTNEWGVVAV